MREDSADPALLLSPEAGQDAALTAALTRACEGHEDAWREIVGRYAGRLFALAKSRCGDATTAQDITQSILATVAIKLRGGEYADLGKFEAYLFRIAVNRIRDEARRRKRAPRHESADALEGVTEHPVSRDEPKELEALRKAIVQLTESDREVVELRHHGGLGFHQMAEILGEPIGTLLARHHRALRKLRAILEADTALDLDGGS